MKKRIILFALFTVFVGYLLITFLYKKTELSLKEELLRQAITIENSIDKSLFYALKGDIDDIDKPEYIYITNIFREFISVYPTYKYIFIMGLNENQQLFYHIEIDLEGIEGETALPGTVYHNDIEKLFLSFYDPAPFVIGPVRDEWGVWYSAIVPIIDKNTGEIIAIFGIDESSKDWAWQIILRLFFPTLLILFIVLLIFRIYNLNKDKKKILISLKREYNQRKVLDDLFRHNILFDNTLSENLNLLCKIIFDTLQPDNCEIWMLFKEEKVLKCVSQKTVNKVFINTNKSILVADCLKIVKSVLKNNNKTLSFTSDDNDYYDFYKNVLKKEKLPKYILHTCFQQNMKVHAIIIIENYHKKRIWEEDEEFFLSVMSSFLGLIYNKEIGMSVRKNLQAINQRFLNTLESMLEGYVYFDDQLICKYINRKTIEILKIDDDDYIGLPIWDFFPTEVLDVIREVITNAMIFIEVQKITKYFNYINKWIEIRIFPKDNFIYCLFIDVTSKKKKNEAYINNQRFSIVGEITATFAKDFDVYLENIIKYTNLLNIEILNHKNIYSEIYPTNDVFFNKISSQINYIIKTTNDALQRVKILQRFAKVKQFDDDFSKININSIILDALIKGIDIWKIEPEKRGVFFTVEKNFNIVNDIIGNETALIETILVFLKNSVEAMPDGGVITFETKQVKSKVHLTISDNGKGMRKKIKNKIFEPYFTTKNLNIGKGLSLSKAHSVITEHKGTIKVLSKEDVGTTFEIQFPC